MGQSNLIKSSFGSGQGHLSTFSVLVFVIVGLGAGLRLDDLDRKSLWGDEVFTIERATQASAHATIRNVKESPFPPGYYLSLRYWLRAVGLSDATLRLPALTFGILVLPATYVAWYPLLGPRASLWALALLALNAFHIWYSTDAKMYSLVWILSTLSSASFLRILLGSPRWSRWCLVYALCNAMLPLVSYVGIVPVLVQVAYTGVITMERPKLRRMYFRLALLNGISIIPFLFWLPVALKAATQRTGIKWIPVTTLADAPAELYRLFGMFLLGYQTSGNHPPNDAWWPGLGGVYGPCVVAAAILLLFNLITSIRAGNTQHDDGSPVTASENNPLAGGRVDPAVIYYLALWLTIPIVETLIFSLTIYSLWGVPRYLAAAAPALTLWLGSALGSLRSQPLSRVLGVLILAGNLQILAFDRSHTTRTPWRDIAGTLRDVAIATNCNAKSHAEILSNNPKYITANLVIIDDKGNFNLFNPLKHAIARVAPSIRVTDITQDFDQTGVGAFFVLHRFADGIAAAQLPQASGPRPTPGFSAHHVRTDTIYEDRFSVAPKPFDPTTLELWLYLAVENETQIPCNRP